MYQITFYAILYAAFNVAGAVLIKKSLAGSAVDNLHGFVVLFLNPKCIVAVSFIVVSMYFSIKAISLSGISVVVPYMTGINFVLTGLCGVLILNEKVGILGFFGMLLIVVGIAVIALDKANL